VPFEDAADAGPVVRALGAVTHFIRRVCEGRARRRKARAPAVIVPALPGSARKIRFVEADQAVLPCPVRFEKNISVFQKCKSGV